MKSDISAAVALEDLNSSSCERIGRSQHVGSLRVPAQRNDRRVLQQKQHIADLSGLAQIDQLALQPEPFAVINFSELDDRNHVAIGIIGWWE